MALAGTSHFILEQKHDGSSITGQQSVFNFHLGLYFPYQSGGRGLKASLVALFPYRQGTVLHFVAPHPGV